MLVTKVSLLRWTSVPTPLTNWDKKVGESKTPRQGSVTKIGLDLSWEEGSVMVILGICGIGGVWAG